MIIEWKGKNYMDKEWEEGKLGEDGEAERCCIEPQDNVAGWKTESKKEKKEIKEWKKKEGKPDNEKKRITGVRGFKWNNNFIRWYEAEKEKQHILCSS